MIYMDDWGIASNDMSEIDAFINRLKEKGFDLTKECTSVLISTPRSPNKTPNSQTALGSDPEGTLIKENWQYSSVVGMLIYFSINTRPDIAFAVSQVAQFTCNPKQSQASAVKMVIRGASQQPQIKASSLPLTLL